MCIRYANLLSAAILEWPTILSSRLITDHVTPRGESIILSLLAVCIYVCAQVQMNCEKYYL